MNVWTLLPNYSSTNQAHINSFFDQEVLFPQGVRTIPYKSDFPTHKLLWSYTALWENMLKGFCTETTSIISIVIDIHFFPAIANIVAAIALCKSVCSARGTMIIHRLEKPNCMSTSHLFKGPLRVRLVLWGCVNGFTIKAQAKLDLERAAVPPPPPATYDNLFVFWKL